MKDECLRFETSSYFPKDSSEPILEYVVTNIIGDNFPLNITNHSTCEINICYDGEFNLGYDGNLIPCKKGDVVLVNPYANHGFSAAKSASFYILGIKNIQFDIPNDNVLVLNCDISDIIQIVEMIKKIHKEKLYPNKNIIPHLLHALIHMVTSNTNVARIPYYLNQGSSLTSRVANYIEKNFRTDITIDSLCEMFFCSKSTLIHSFKEDYNTTVMNFLKARRIKEIKFWLTISDRPVSDIANDNGFNTLPYFYKYFYRLEGMTPQQYREKNKTRN